MPLTYGQLPEKPRYGVSLRCQRPIDPNCFETYSAYRGDYFMIPDAEPIKCNCGAPLALVEKIVTYAPVAPENAGKA